MKLTTKNLLIILGVLAVAFSVTQFTKRSGRSKSLKSELVSIDTANVSKIEISSIEGNVTLSQINGAWSVSLPDGNQKAAKKSSVFGLLNSLGTIEPGRLAAKAQDKWKDYAVDSTGTRVKVYEGEKVSTDIVIGRFGMEGQQSFYTFVRLFEDDEVYVANDFMGMSIGKKAASYRENQLLRLSKDSLNAIVFDYPDSAFTLTKGEQWYLQDQVADSASVASYLNGLSYVNSQKFYVGEVRPEATYKITFSFSDQPEITIEGYLTAEGIVIQSSENSYELFLDNALEEKLFKSKSAFLTTSD